MARLLALEWDAREARVALARSRGREVTIEQAFAVDLGPRDPGETFADTNVGDRVASALVAHGIGTGDVLVAIGRASIELRHLQLPPVPEEELPDLVRFQALRQFSTIAEEWPVDYYRLHDEDENIRVLAAAISPELVGQIQQTCSAGHLSPTRMVLRPFAAAALLRRWDSPGGDCRRLMVDLLADEADLTVVDSGDVVFMRTVRLSGQPGSEAQVRALVGEIRRTSVAAQNQLGGRRVEQIVLYGVAEENAELKTAIESQLSTDVELFNPFDVLSLGPNLRRETPANVGRFASLLGMLADEAESTAHAIDFLHPKERPTPPNRRRRTVLLAALAASLVVAAIGYGWMQLKNKDREIARFAALSKTLDEKVVTATKQLRELNEVQQFADSDVTWLDEIHELAGDLPAADDVILTQVTLAERTPRGGQIILEGYVREYSLIRDMERKLTDKRHRVFGDRGNLDARRDTYRWQFREKILVEPSEPLSETDAGVQPADSPAAETQPGGAAELSSDVTGDETIVEDGAGDESPGVESTTEQEDDDAMDQEESTEQATPEKATAREAAE